MEFKRSLVIDDHVESGVNGITGLALGKRDRQELTSAVALLEDTILPLGGGNNPLQLTPAEWHESDTRAPQQLPHPGIHGAARAA